VELTSAAASESTSSTLAESEGTGDIFTLEEYLQQLEKLVDDISAPVGQNLGIITIELTGATDGSGTATLTPESSPEAVPTQTLESKGTDTCEVKELYQFIPGDTLNFREKDNMGISFSEIYKKIAQLTNNLTSELVIQNLDNSDKLRKVTDEVKITLEIAHKVRIGKNISERERVF